MAINITNTGAGGRLRIRSLGLGGRFKSIYNAPLFLDNYPGAVMAYSFRRLSKNYTGPAMTIRRDSDNAETDLYYVNDFLDTTTMNSFGGGANIFIKKWYDQSGYNYHVEQTTTAYQPRIYWSGSLRTIGGKATAYFAPSNFNDTIKRLSYDALIPDFGNTSYAAFAVAENTNDEGNFNGQQQIMFGHLPEPVGSGATSGPGIVWTTESPRNYYYQTATSTRLNSGILVSLGAKLFTLMYSGGNAYFGINGQSYVSSSTTITPIRGHFSLSGNTGSPNYSWIGHISEVIIYPFDQLSNDTNIKTNISSYYGITL